MLGWECTSYFFILKSLGFKHFAGDWTFDWNESYTKIFKNMLTLIKLNKIGNVLGEIWNPNYQIFKFEYEDNVVSHFEPFFGRKFNQNCQSGTPRLLKKSNFIREGLNDDKLTHKTLK